jgi:transcription initiation factor TFIID subunit TAF12
VAHIIWQQQQQQQQMQQKSQQQRLQWTVVAILVTPSSVCGRTYQLRVLAIRCCIV